MSQMQYASAKAQIANEKGIANGVASLDGSGKVPSSQLPSYVDDVLEYSSQSAFPDTGEIGKIYVATDTNKSYRWSGSTYIELSAYALATQAAAGLMSATDKTKLDGVAEGATANVGTITGIKMNNTSKGTSGVVDLGTVITAHQDISGKVSGPASATDGTIPLFDGATGKAIKAGKTITDTTSSTAIANNANIPTNRTVLNGIYNGLDKTASGFALDARKGKEINDKFGGFKISAAQISGTTNDSGSMSTGIPDTKYVICARTNGNDEARLSQYAGVWWVVNLAKNVQYVLTIIYVEYA